MTAGVADGKNWSFCASICPVVTLLLERSRSEAIPLATVVRNQDRAPPQSSVNRASTIAATDGELLMRFVRQRDQGAFADVVERHGRLVWMICRQVLRHHQDVEDAFQATFLILAQRARSIHASDSAAAWLYKVAMRTALAARRKRSTRREEPLAAEPAAGEAVMPIIDDREMLYVLLQEVRMLPARYQTPLVMRYLEGQSRRAIAEQTDSTVGQVQGRLARGRRILRSRFLRRGVSLSLAAGAVAATKNAAAAAVSSPLVESTAATCLANNISGSATGITPAALALAKEGVQAMWFALATKCTAIVTSIALAGGIVWAAQQGGGNNEHENGAGTNAAPWQVNLLAADRSKKSEEPANARAEGQAKPNTTAETSISPQERLAGEAARQREQAIHAIDHETHNLTDILTTLRNSRSGKTAGLEMAQLDKAMLQRRVERLSDKLAELEMQTEVNTPKEVSQEERQRLLSARDKVARMLEDAKQDLRKQATEVAQLSADLEELQSEMGRKQRRLEELDRQVIQLQFPPESQPAPDTKKVSEDTWRVSEEAWRAGPRPPADYVLLPDDVLMVRAKGSLADGPIENSFRVDTMGTIALGPQYGSVKVEGLNFIQAQNEIRQKLSASASTPDGLDVQAKIVGWRANAVSDTKEFSSKLQEMGVAIEQLRTDNAKLKKELQQFSTKSIGHTR
jgi:RNA polymerase sigma factor (sigma-70 family)